MRIDRTISLGLVQPLVRLLSPQSEKTLPILMYHSISGDPEPGVGDYYRVCTSPARFAEHMTWLAEAGWKGVSLREGLGWLSASMEGPPPRGPLSERVPGHAASNARPNDAPLRPVAITFDDGLQDFDTNAMPALRKHGFSATMYLATAYIGNERKTFKNRPCLTWSEVRSLSSDGIEFGSHTVNHPTLVEQTDATIARELLESRQTIENELGQRCPSFAYPYAFPEGDADFVQRFHEHLSVAGYENCVTTAIGRANPSINPFRLPRLPANEADDRDLFLAKLSGAYDWLALPQRLSKRSKQMLRGRRLQPSTVT